MCLHPPLRLRIAYPKWKTRLLDCFVLSNLPWADREFYHVYIEQFHHIWLITQPALCPIRPSSDYLDGVAMSNHYEGFHSEHFLSISILSHCGPAANSSRQALVHRPCFAQHWPRTLNRQPLILKRQEGQLTTMSVYMYRNILEKESPTFKDPNEKGGERSKDIYKKVVHRPKSILHYYKLLTCILEKAMAPHSSTLA